MRRWPLAFAALAVFAGPAGAQDMAGMPGMGAMPGMAMPMPSKPPAKKAPPTKAGPRKPAGRAAPTAKGSAPHAAMPGMAMPAAGTKASGDGAQASGNGSPGAMQGMTMPPAPAGHAGAAPDAGMAAMAGMGAMPGMAMPGMAVPPAPADHAGMATPPAAAPASGGMAAMPGMGAMGGMAGMAGMAGTAAGGTPAPGNAPAPAPPATFYADRTYGPAAMDEARRRMMREEGGRPFYQLLFNLAEYQARAGGDGFRWDGEAWFGGDRDRLAFRTEGEGGTDGRVDDAEIQVLWSRAIGAYANLQGGLRQDLGSGPKRTYASFGAETLTPYMIEAEGRLFVSTRGEVLARAEAWIDQRLTQRLILQPRAELNFAAQSAQATGIGRGLSDAELGLRLRYEIGRRFAPYLGVSYEAETGRTARFSREAGRDPTRTSLVAGVRFWF